MTRTLLVVALSLPVGLVIALTIRALTKATNPDAANSLVSNMVRATIGALIAAANVNFGFTGQASWPWAIGLAALPAVLTLWFVRRAIVAARHLRDR